MHALSTPSGDGKKAFSAFYVVVSAVRSIRTYALRSRCRACVPCITTAMPEAGVATADPASKPGKYADGSDPSLV